MNDIWFYISENYGSHQMLIWTSAVLDLYPSTLMSSGADCKHEDELLIDGLVTSSGASPYKIGNLVLIVDNDCQRFPYSLW